MKTRTMIGAAEVLLGMNSTRAFSDDTNPPWPQLADRLGLEPRPSRLARIESDGFSGTLLWRVRLPPSESDVSLRRSRELIVRRLPVGADVSRLTHIRDILEHVFRSGCTFVPVPLTSIDGSSVIELDDAYWQVEPAFSGRANYVGTPSEYKMQQAMEALARWHLSARTYRVLANGVAPGIESRLNMCQTLQTDDGMLARLGSVRHKAELHPIGRFFSPFVGVVKRNLKQLVERLEFGSALSVPIQFCVRDIHRDHLLFSDTDARLTAIVDYDAVRPDCVAADLSRLLRSLTARGSDDWNAAIACYEAVRPLQENERALLAAYDFANCLLSGIQWLIWVFLEERQFDWTRVERRLDTLLAALNSN